MTISLSVIRNRHKENNYFFRGYSIFLEVGSQ